MRLLKERSKINGYANRENLWEIDKATPKYKNYILVIGESVRRDYMSIYGYPLKTTPFFDRVNGTFWTNYYSPDGYTIASLLKTLIKGKNQGANYHFNVVSLANKANFDTYWISNQGLLGGHDSQISAMAFYAKDREIMYYGDFYLNPHSDWQVLPSFEKFLNKKTEKSKLIVVHLIGSHSAHCNRVSSDYGIEPITNTISKNMDCYLTSIKQTDRLLETFYEKLKSKNERFSIMYFADHGLMHYSRSPSDASVIHGNKYKSNFSVPMAVISSDDTQQTLNHANKSGAFFVDYFAHWLGIESPQINKENNLFDNKSLNSVQVLDGQDLNTFEEDPVILPQ